MSVHTALAEALALAFPTWCAGCDEPDFTLCDACASALAAAEPVHRTHDGLAIHSALRFEGVPARVLRAFKEDGRTSLARPLGRAIAPLAERAGWADAVLVPVPSSRAAVRRRGYGAAELLARRSGLTTIRLLRSGGAAADQRGLGRLERARNVEGTMSARGDHRGRVVVFDDVVTTGATLHEAERALIAAGAVVLGAITVASTERKTRWPNS